MPRRVRAARLETRTSRLKLPIAINPHDYTLLAPGIALGYRRCKGPGRWQIRVANGAGSYWFRVIGMADDREEADGESILDWWQAQAKALAVARGKDDVRADAPATIDTALADYAIELKAHGRDPRNASRVRRHLPPGLLSKTVALVTSRELLNWRNGLVEAGANPATVSRTAKALRAALSLASKHDKTIDRTVWRDALAKLPDNKPREFVVSDEKVLELIDAAHDLDPAFGLLIEVAAVTGARISQLAAIKVADLHDGADPKLGVPASRKGHRAKRAKEIALPITPGLAARLRAAAGDRPACELLLLKADGASWNAEKPSGGNDADQLEPFAIIAAQCGLAGQTMYLLRHASICRQILRGVPLALVADNHDTSTHEITRTYGWFINKHERSDHLTRAALLDPEVPAAEKVVALRKA